MRPHTRLSQKLSAQGMTIQAVGRRIASRKYYANLLPEMRVNREGRARISCFWTEVHGTDQWA